MQQQKKQVAKGWVAPSMRRSFPSLGDLLLLLLHSGPELEQPAAGEVVGAAAAHGLREDTRRFREDHGRAIEALHGPRFALCSSSITRLPCRRFNVGPTSCK